MTKRQWMVIAAISLAVAAIAVWFMLPRRLAEEQIVADRLRAAKVLYVQTNLGNVHFFGPERLTLDGEALARRFRLEQKLAGKTVSINTSVVLRENSDRDEIVRLCPPTCCFIDGVLFTNKPGFWTELLRQAPQTKQWLLENAPNLFEENDEPIDR